MTSNYNYLKQHMAQNYVGDIIMIEKNNIFYPLETKEVNDSEGRINYPFPSELKDFYLSIGYGHLTTPTHPPSDYKFYSSNEILPPHIAVDYMLGILQHPEEGDYYMAESAYELLQPGDLPFFEISDSSSFMIMKLNSDNPNAVWFMGHEKIEDSFEKFIWNLYYDHPSYYSRGW